MGSMGFDGVGGDLPELGVWRSLPRLPSDVRP
jgi:hypothetical protein